MRIERVEPILVKVPFGYGTAGERIRDAIEILFVRIDTDEGITGWGEAFGFKISPVTREAIEVLIAPRCIGRDPSDIPALMAALARALTSGGRSGPVAYGLSGIDIALWDIAGKVAGKPVHALLGDTAPERIPAYASLLGFHDAGRAARNAAAALDDGYAHIKLHERDAPSVAAARQAIGEATPLMLDVNCAWTPDEALAMARELQPYGLRWLEEPVWPPEDRVAMKRIHAETAIAVAAGENALSATDAVGLARDGAVDVMQPSVTKIGGISAVRDIIAAAAGSGAEIVPHSPYVGPGLVATVHLIAALLPGVVCERFYLDLDASPIGAWVDVAAGTMAVPGEPGLGFTVDERVLERYRVA
jgi:L-alanine-DL-glutamate epimerase-like enolase superfamily enzyme